MFFSLIVIGVPSPVGSCSGASGAGRPDSVTRTIAEASRPSRDTLPGTRPRAVRQRVHGLALDGRAGAGPRPWSPSGRDAPSGTSRAPGVGLAHDVLDLVVPRALCGSRRVVVHAGRSRGQGRRDRCCASPKTCVQFLARWRVTISRANGGALEIVARAGGDIVAEELLGSRATHRRAARQSGRACRPARRSGPPRASLHGVAQCGRLTIEILCTGSEFSSTWPTSVAALVEHL